MPLLYIFVEAVIIGSGEFWAFRPKLGVLFSRTPNSTSLPNFDTSTHMSENEAATEIIWQYLIFAGLSSQPASLLFVHCSASDNQKLKRSRGQHSLIRYCTLWALDYSGCN